MHSPQGAPRNFPQRSEVYHRELHLAHPPPPPVLLRQTAPRPPQEPGSCGDAQAAGQPEDAGDTPAAKRRQGHRNRTEKALIMLSDFSDFQEPPPPPLGAPLCVHGGSMVCGNDARSTVILGVGGLGMGWLTK